MLTAILLLVGTVLIGMALGEHPVRHRAVSPAIVYLLVGWGAARLGTPLAEVDPVAQSGVLVIVSEWAVLISLFAIGLRLRVPPKLRIWRSAAWLASLGMVVTIALAALAAHQLLGLGWAAAVLLGGIMAPTDPVLASDVQTRSPDDRDAVRVTLTAEGALNDGSAFPAVMLALGLLGLHELGGGIGWVWGDLLWPIGGGLALGWAFGRGIGRLVQALLRRRGGLGWDELLFVGCIALCHGLALLLHVSAFMAVFVAGATLFHGSIPPVGAAQTPGAGGPDLMARMMAFGGRCERLVEAGMVLFIGAAMTWIQWSGPQVLFALVLALVVRPLTVAAVVWPRTLPRTQRRLVGWFGIRGVGSLFYLAFVLQEGLPGPLARQLVSVCVLSIAVSIVLHGVSATPLMGWYQKRRAPRRPR